MMCYKDRWWCPFFDTCAYRERCDRPLTIAVKLEAEASGLLIQVVMDKPECHSDFIVAEPVVSDPA